MVLNSFERLKRERGMQNAKLKRKRKCINNSVRSGSTSCCLDVKETNTSQQTVPILFERKEQLTTATVPPTGTELFNPEYD